MRPARILHLDFSPESCVYADLMATLEMQLGQGAETDNWRIPELKGEVK